MLNTNAIFARITALMLLAVLAGCSGGGGGGGGTAPAPLVYTGNTSQALISSTNAARLTANLISDAEAVGSLTSSAAPSGAMGVREIGRRLGAAFRVTPLPSESGAQRLTSVPVDVTDFCESGSVRVTGDLSESGTGTLNITWSNCRFGEFALNGTATAQVAAFDRARLIITNGTFSTSRLTLSGPDGTSEVAGTVSILVETIANRQTTTSNIVTRDASGRLSKTEPLIIVDVLTFNLTSFNETISGRVFDSVHGFVDISTTPAKPLTFSTFDQTFPDTGQVVLLGANGAHIRVSAVSQQTVSVELDLNGDNLYETAASLAWNDLSGPLAADLGDDDRDGMHNSWEDAKGLNRASASDAAVDSDSDGATNLLEYLAGTDPRSTTPLTSRPRPQVSIVSLSSSVGMVFDPGTYMVFDPGTQKIYASISNGFNQVVPIDPATGVIGTAIQVGTGPAKLALSGNGHLYVGLKGDPVVQRINLASGTVQTFPLAQPTYFADDLQVLPGNPDAFAVFIRSPATASSGVAIYENGMERSATTIFSGSQGSILEFGASADTLYSYNNETSEFGFRRLKVDGDGVSVIDVTPNLITGHNVIDIRFSGGLIYSTDGRVIDPDKLNLDGASFAVPSSFGNLVLPDAALGRMFFLVRDGLLYRLYTFDLQSRALVGIHDLPEVVGDPATSLIRWGARGLAFRTNAGQVVLLQLR